MNYFNQNPYPNLNGVYPQYMKPNFPKYEIIKVNGENGAKSLQMAENSSVLLLDETAPIVWLAQTDGAGYKTVTPYKISPVQQEAPIDTKSLEKRIEALEAKINAKSNFTEHDGKLTTDAESAKN